MLIPDYLQLEAKETNTIINNKIGHTKFFWQGRYSINWTVCLSVPFNGARESMLRKVKKAF